MKSLRITFFLFLIILCGCNPRENPLFKKLATHQSEKKTAQTKEAIEKSSILKDLDALCKKLPLGDKFQLVRMDMGNKSHFLVYYYISDEKYESVKILFNQYFAKERWQSGETNEALGTPRFEFTNEKYKVSISYWDGENKEEGNYAILCGLR